jgi:hypothetical protein
MRYAHSSDAVGARPCAPRRRRAHFLGDSHRPARFCEALRRVYRLHVGLDASRLISWAGCAFVVASAQMIALVPRAGFRRRAFSLGAVSASPRQGWSVSALAMGLRPFSERNKTVYGIPPFPLSWSSPGPEVSPFAHSIDIHLYGGRY